MAAAYTNTAAGNDIDLDMYILTISIQSLHVSAWVCGAGVHRHMMVGRDGSRAGLIRISMITDRCSWQCRVVGISKCVKVLQGAVGKIVKRSRGGRPASLPGDSCAVPV